MPAHVGFLEGGRPMGRVSALCLAGKATAWLPSHWQLPGIPSVALLHHWWHHPSFRSAIQVVIVFAKQPVYS